ncbi:hypothetical protein ANCCAN_21135 [Ancylostoma caninum]|uniref:Glycosyltransferase family 92 protein n=1 Tax=Ancylostoma caninum TaxID=29170 RepID=A0A368FLC9_ANCCA|nr:hypothetical protein ANCCAN_21135 [Ancylostoma caninum]
MELEPAVKSVGFPEFAYYCCKHPLAKYMSISETENEVVNFTLPVLDRRTDNPKYTLSLCLAPFYGDLEKKWLLLAELLEHYKLQGVEHFYIYIKDIDSYTLKLIDDYAKTGEAEVVFFREEQDRTSLEWQHVEIEDCALRSMHHSRYSIFADLDERITAMGNSTLVEYISRKMCSATKGEQTLLEHLPTLNFRNSSTATPTGVATKCVADTRRVMAMGIHKAYILMPGYETFFVPANQAISL